MRRPTQYSIPHASNYIVFNTIRCKPNKLPILDLSIHRSSKANGTRLMAHDSRLMAHGSRLMAHGKDTRGSGTWALAGALFNKNKTKQQPNNWARTRNYLASTDSEKPKTDKPDRKTAHSFRHCHEHGSFLTFAYAPISLL